MSNLESEVLESIYLAAKKVKVDELIAIGIIDSYYKGIRRIIEEHKPTVIKIDYFGKFIYSEAWKDKKKTLRKNESIND